MSVSQCDSVFNGEIYTKTNYLQHEHRLFDFFCSQLCLLGWTPVDPYQRHWQKQTRDVILCLADNFTVCKTGLHHVPAKWFTDSAVIITDNHVSFVPRYHVQQLPTSYFGIYAYQPQYDVWDPVKDMGLSINRMDRQRCEILLEWVRQSGGISPVLAGNFINFNAWTADSSVSQPQKTWRRITHNLDLDLTEHKKEIERLLPLRNHEFSIEHAHMKVWLNCVVETYAGDYVIAFSEKIFRALSMPAPWMLYGARGAIQRLDSLGFDVMHDMIDHSYDKWWHQGKTQKFWRHAQVVLDGLKNIGVRRVRMRCQRAAMHNQNLLQALKRQWPSDFARYLPGVIQNLQA